MSKAFTKENDGASEPELRSSGPDLPPGAKNYMTQAGANRLKDELEKLLQSPKLLQQQFELRMRYLRLRLDELVVIDPNDQPKDTVRFGATVELTEENGSLQIYRIVGVDEADPTQGQISWISPLARALLGAQEGDVVSLRTPKGLKELEVQNIRYLTE